MVPLHRCARWLIVVAAAAAVLTLPSPARAQVHASIVELVLEGNLTAETTGAITEALVAGLRPAVSSVRRPEESLGSNGDEAAVDADVLVYATVDQLEQHYSVEVELRHARDRSSLARSSLECSACTWSEALSTITRAARSVTSGLPGFVTIAVTPSGATVSIDGEEWSDDGPLALAPGTHRVEARREGYLPLRREIRVVSGARSEISLTLSARTAGTSERTGWRATRVAAWITGAISVAALIPGVVWLAVDGQCPVDWQGAGPCPEVYDTWPQGLGVTIGGAALLITSVVLFVASARRRSRSSSLAGVSIAGGSTAIDGGLF